MKPILHFCSNCGEKLKFGEVPDEHMHRHFCAGCGVIHYQNPNMIVGCLPRWQDKVLLCKRAIEPRKDLWTLPAGFLEYNETAEDGAVRETVEEANADVEIVRLFSVYSLPHVGQVYLMFLANLQNLNFHSGPESSEVTLYKQDEIPWDQIAFSAVRFTLEKYFEDRTNKNSEVHLGSHSK